MHLPVDNMIPHTSLHWWVTGCKVAPTLKENLLSLSETPRVGLTPSSCVQCQCEAGGLCPSVSLVPEAAGWRARPPPPSHLCTQTPSVIKYSRLFCLSALMDLFPSAHRRLVVQEGFNVMECRRESAAWMLPSLSSPCGLNPPPSTSINLLLHSGSSSFPFTCPRLFAQGDNLPLVYPALAATKGTVWAEGLSAAAQCHDNATIRKHSTWKDCGHQLIMEPPTQSLKTFLIQHRKEKTDFYTLTSS